MAIKILKSTDPVEVKTVTVMVFGQPGIGKTTLGFTARKPLLLDFDAGAHRSGYRGDSVPISSWADIKSLSKDDLAPYETIVIDTVGRCLDVLSMEVIRLDAKNAKRSGSLSLQGYGELKSSFAQWLTSLRSMGLDVVLVAHDKEEKKGDDLIVRPEAAGSSASEVFKVSEAVGYYHLVGGSRVIDFSPSDEWLAKDAGRVGRVSVPHADKEPEFLGGLLDRIKSSLGDISERSRVVREKVADYAAKVDLTESADELTKLLEEVKAEEDTSVVQQGRHLINDRRSALGFEWDKKKNRFFLPDEAKVEEREPEQAAIA